MSDLAAALKAEISRLARKEVKATVQPLRKSLAELRQVTWELKRENAALAKQLGKVPKPPVTVQPTPEPDLAEGVRFSSGNVRRVRQRLGLSMPQLAKLLGVSPNSIYNWEHGRARPTPRLLAKLVAVRRWGKRQAKQMLAAPGK